MEVTVGIKNEALALIDDELAELEEQLQKIYAQEATEYCDTDGIHPLDKGYNQAYIPLIRKALQMGTDK